MLHCCHKHVNARTLIELKVIRGRSIPPSGFIGYLGPAQWARVLPVEPSGYTELAEDVTAPQPHWGRVVVMADGAGVAGR